MIALAVLGTVLALVLWPRERITPQNFAKVRVGMSKSELRPLLGPPQYQSLEFGLVNGPDSFTTNSSQSKEVRRRRGFREYRFEQWSSQKLSIIAISDLQGHVVCRYAGSGQKGGNWSAFIRAWLSRRY